MQYDTSGHKWYPEETQKYTYNSNNTISGGTIESLAPNGNVFWTDSIGNISWHTFTPVPKVDGYKYTLDLPLQLLYAGGDEYNVIDFWRYDTDSGRSIKIQELSNTFNSNGMLSKFELFQRNNSANKYEIDWRFLFDYFSDGFPKSTLEYTDNASVLNSKLSWGGIYSRNLDIDGDLTELSWQYYQPATGWRNAGKSVINYKSSGIENTYPITMIRMFPVPANNILNISLSTGILNSFEITDISGKQILRKISGLSEEKIDISGLKPGVYLVNLQTSKGSATLKFIK
jgi:hypothetical protein